MKRNPLLTSLRTRSTVAAVAVTTVAGLALCGVAVGASTSVAHTTQAQTATSTAAETTKPTVVLVHGGWADSSGWNAEITALQKKGYPVIAPANPLRGLTSDADYVRSVLQTIDGPIVLVGHSYGGAVISNAARGVDNVEALVYIAAFAPDTGESLAQLVNQNPGTHITPDALIERPYPLAGGGTGVDLYIKAEVFREAFAGDLPRKTTNLMQADAAARSRSPRSPSPPASRPGRRSRRGTSSPPTTTPSRPRPSGSWPSGPAPRSATVAASHVPMMSQPTATTRVILEAAASLG